MHSAGPLTQLKVWFDRYRAAHGGSARNTAGLLLTFLLIPLVLLALEFFGWQLPFYRFAATTNYFGPLTSNEMNLYAQLYTSASFLVLFVLVPLVFHALLPTGEKNPFGLRVGALRAHVRSYLPLIVLIVPVLWIAAGSPRFHEFYPLYKPPSAGAWLGYEAVYMSQFFAVEFFFRGFCLFRVERMIPGYGVFFMLTPYVLIHIHKPLPEAVSSIVAGTILGFLALRSRSIWPGVVVHCTVAFSMDFFSLVRSGTFPPW